METVYKYSIPIEDSFWLSLPEGAKVLTVQMQHRSAQLWALVNPDNPAEARRFRLAGTGHPITTVDVKNIYIGTFQVEEGTLIFHLFEVKALAEPEMSSPSA